MPKPNDGYYDEIGRGYPNKERDGAEMAYLAEQLGTTPDGAQIATAARWHDQNQNFSRQTDKMVEDILAGRTEKYEAEAKAQLKARSNG